MFMFHTLTLEKETLAKFKKLKVIGRLGVGYNNIDIKAAADLGKSYNAPAASRYKYVYNYLNNIVPVGGRGHFHSRNDAYVNLKTPIFIFAATQRPPFFKKYLTF